MIFRPRLNQDQIGFDTWYRGRLLQQPSKKQKKPPSWQRAIEKHRWAFFFNNVEGIRECLANGRHNFRRQRPATTFTPSKPSNMKTFCEVCTTNPAALVCCADDEVMCGSCDER